VKFILYLASFSLSSYLVPVDLLAYHSVYPIIDRYLPHTFTLFTALLQIVTFCAFFWAGFTPCYRVVIHIVAFRRFHFTLLDFHVHCRITPFISYSMIGFAFFVFVSRHADHLFLFLVNCMSCG